MQKRLGTNQPVYTQGSTSLSSVPEWRRFESTAREIIEECRQFFCLQSVEQKVTVVVGSSGYGWHIDILGHEFNGMGVVLFECRLKGRNLVPEEVGGLAYRALDIGASRAFFVTVPEITFSAGARLIADCEGIGQICIDRSATLYNFSMNWDQNAIERRNVEVGDSIIEQLDVLLAWGVASDSLSEIDPTKPTPGSSSRRRRSDQGVLGIIGLITVKLEGSMHLHFCRVIPKSQRRNIDDPWDSVRGACCFSVSIRIHFSIVNVSVSLRRRLEFDPDTGDSIDTDRVSVLKGKKWSQENHLGLSLPFPGGP